MLLRKHYLVAKRSKTSTCLFLIGIPLGFMLLVLILAQAASLAIPYSAGEFKTQPEEPFVFPSCNEDFDPDCYTITYNKGDNAKVQQVIEYMRKGWNIPTNRLHGLNGDTNINEYLWENKNKTLMALNFTFTEWDDTTIDPDIAFWINVNRTTEIPPRKTDDYIDWFVPVQLALQEALFNVIGEIDYKIEVDRMKYPHPALATADPIASLLPGLMPLIFLIQMILILTAIVTEKQERIRFGMKQMGLSPVAYVLSWFIYCMVMLSISTIVLILSGIALGYNFFTVNSFWVYIVAYLDYFLVLITICFLLTTLVKKAKNAMIVGLMVYFLTTISSLIAELLIFAIDLPGWQLGFSFFAPVLFNRIINALSVASISDQSPGISWGDISDNAQFYPISQCLNMIFVDAMIYLLISQYLEYVLPSVDHMGRNPLFFTKPEFWNPSHEIVIGEHTQVENEDEDVREERESLLRHEEKDPEPVIKLYNVTKVFTKLLSIVKLSTNFKAVDSLFLSIPPNSLLALLGHNGSGKTTTINMLTGMLRPTRGTAMIAGMNVRSQIGEVRTMLGVCPQHDILFDQLNAREHLELYAGIKGMDPSKIPGEIEEKLQEVDLVDVGNQLAGEYSGGMKRRLSVAIALTGDPQIVLLDEPTTGMDPVARRHVWDIIQRAKEDRVILLTTHSMEEADVLSDTVAILSNGRLRCIGSSLHLKNKYGSGYRLNLSLIEGSTILSQVEEWFDNPLIHDHTESKMIIEIPKIETPKLPDFLDFLKANKTNTGVADFSVSLTTLEEVFLQITHLAHEERFRELMEEVGHLPSAKNALIRERKRRLEATSYKTMIYHNEETDSSQGE